ncbi:MAG: cytochrome P460 family protein [Thermodesulfobacteriota bacterium]
MTFADWQSWKKLNTTPLLSKGHGDIYVDIYVDDRAKETYLTASSLYPECARIVKAQYNDKSAAKKVDELTIMVKMAEGYDPDYNDWWYARYEPTGTKAIASGKMGTECRVCHEQASKTDYLFSKEVNAAASE